MQQTKEKHRIFRQAAIEAKHTSWLGQVILIRPITFSFLTALTAAMATVIIAFLILGTYTKRSRVSGHLVPSSGLLKVYAQQPGIVLEKRVVEGQKVRRGDILFVLSSERQSSTLGNTQANISSQVEARKKSLHAELEKNRFLQQDERNALTEKIASLQTELLKLDSQIEGQRNRVKLSKNTFSRYENLQAQGYISKDQLQQKQEELLDQHNRLHSLERDHIAIKREISIRKYELSGLALKHQNQLANIDRSIKSAEQELSESEAKRRLIVTAPENGTATAALVDIGQAVDASKTLISIVPEGSILQAQLYAPSKAIGFVKPMDMVLLRYQAYPYQKFGHAVGTVAYISKTALDSTELGIVGGNGSYLRNGGNREPLYRITVNLSSQTITAYGKQQTLQPGMLFDADVLLDKRRLYEWVLEPLFSVTGKI